MNPTAAPTAPRLTRDTVLARLDEWVAQGWLRDLDRAFAAFLQREAPGADPLLILAAALASHQLGRGHACLALDATLADAGQALALPPEPPRAGGQPAIGVTPSALLAGVDLARWRAALADARLVADADADAEGSGGGGGGGGDDDDGSAAPLVLAGARLYLRRYWQYEQQVRRAIADRLRADRVPAPDPALLRQALQALFPQAQAGAGTDWQRVACALAARQAFGIITGGPGTGKTTTVVKLLAVLQHLSLQTAGRRLRIRLAAPTGKAAARLNDSIAGAVRSLVLDALPDPDALRRSIPTAVGTLHRLLGSRPDTRRFRHDARHPLPLDVLVIDEASMIDLEMMAAVFAALPPHARLVLLGDKDQLASVEAGAVLGELCRRADAGHYTPATRDWLDAVVGDRLQDIWGDPQGGPLDQAVVKLRRSYRFDAASGIGRLAAAVNAGDLAALRDIQAEAFPDLAQVDVAADEGALRRLVLDGAGVDTAPSLRRGYRHYLMRLHALQPPADAAQAAFDAWAREVLGDYGQFQLLCAVRGGPRGVEGMNRQVAAWLADEGLIPAATGWYLGRPVMVTRNDPGLGLMNGDVGITLALPPPAAEPRAAAKLRVAFPAGDGSGGIRWVLPSRLQCIETVFAMTVHKSQGSEFVHAALLLPERPSPVLTRELVYTGITRARQWFTCVTCGHGRAVLEGAVQRRVIRSSGLIESSGAARPRPLR